MGIEPYLLSSSLTGVISQRLIKLLCPKCNKEYLASDKEKKLMKLDITDKIYLYKPIGCDHCNNGYLGRTAIYEVLKIDNSIRDLIDKNSNINRIKDSALRSGMVTLLDSAKELLLKGVTSLDEVVKIMTM